MSSGRRLWSVVTLLLVLALAGCSAVSPVMDDSHDGHGDMAAVEESDAGTEAEADAEADDDEADPDETDHGGHGSMMDGDVPFDAQFIDGMIEHHVGAVAMAELVLAESERPELLALAEAIIAAQSEEIDMMNGWRAAWYPDLPASSGMDMDMGAMEIADDPAKPFDQRFLEAMISHHEGAIEMARAAQTMGEHEEVRSMADAVIEVQQAEIDQMRAWLAEWFDVE